MNLECKALKVTAVLNPEAVVGILTPNGVAKATLHINAGGGQYVADVNMKSLRRCIATIIDPAWVILKIVARAAICLDGTRRHAQAGCGGAGRASAAGYRTA